MCKRRDKPTYKPLPELGVVLIQISGMILTLIFNYFNFTIIKLSVYYSGGQPAPGAGSFWYLCPYTTYHIYVHNDTYCSLSNYEWHIPEEWTEWYTYQNMISINTNSTPYARVTVDAQTCCGATTEIIGYFSEYWKGQGVQMRMA